MTAICFLTKTSFDEENDVLVVGFAHGTCTEELCKCALKVGHGRKGWASRFGPPPGASRPSGITAPERRSMRFSSVIARAPAPTREGGESPGGRGRMSNSHASTDSGDEENLREPPRIPEERLRAVYRTSMTLTPSQLRFCP